MSRSPLDPLRELCLALPDAHEVLAWGEPTFRVNNKMFATYAASGNHHGAGRPAVWVKAVSANQTLMVKASPGRYFVPPYVGVKGWIGVWLDEKPDWETLAELLSDAYMMTAPKSRAKPGAKAIAKTKAKPKTNTNVKAKPKATTTAKATSAAKRTRG